jgi:hypothetical protein
MRCRDSRRLAALAALATVIFVRPTIAADESPDPDHTMAVTGRLVDAGGKPVAGGEIVLVAERWCRTERPLGIYVHNGFPISFRVSGPFRTDGQGRFAATAAVGPALPAWDVFALARADGHGRVRVGIDKWARKKDITITLDREHVIRGRLIDTQGQPIAGATVRPILVSQMGTTRETLIPTEPVPPYASPLFPAVSTDDKGRFLIAGLGKSEIWLEATHERFATQRMHPQPSLRSDAKDVSFSLVAARVLEGRVTCGPDGKPAVRAWVVAITGFDNVVQCLTDSDGRYSLNPFPGDSLSLTVFPPDGQPYLVQKKGLTFSQSARLEADVILQPGVLVGGRVTESPSGKPVAGALVLHRPRQANIPGKKYEFAYELEWYRDALTSATSGADGTFKIAVPAGPGHLFVLGPTLDYVPVESSVGELEFGRPSRMRNYPDGIIAIDPKPGSKTEEAAISLRRGVTLRARVVAADGKPVARLIVMSRLYLPTSFYNWQAAWNVLEVHDGELDLPGCDPAKGGTAWLLAPEQKLGLTLNFSGSEASGPRRSIRLEPCANAVVRTVNGKGEALQTDDIHLYAMFSPGTIMAATVLSEKDDKDLEGDWCFWNNFYHVRPERDDKGFLTYTGLVPGLPYALATFEGFDFRKGSPKVDFQVKPGETLKLPDFVIGK